MMVVFGIELMPTVKYISVITESTYEIKYQYENPNVIPQDTIWIIGGTIDQRKLLGDELLYNMCTPEKEGILSTFENTIYPVITRHKAVWQWNYTIPDSPLFVEFIDG